MHLHASLDTILLLGLTISPNDLCDGIESVIYLFADDCSVCQKIDKNYHKCVNTLNRQKMVQRLAFYS